MTVKLVNLTSKKKCWYCDKMISGSAWYETGRDAPGKSFYYHVKCDDGYERKSERRAIREYLANDPG